MTPTATALELLAPLRWALDQVRAMVSQRAFDPATAKMPVAIACTDYVHAAVVIPLVVALRMRAPGLRVALRHLDITQLVVQIARGEVDPALMTPNFAPSSLRTRHLFDERYVLIGRRLHPRPRAGLTAAQFVRLELIIVSLEGGGFVTPVGNALIALRLRRNVVLSAGSFLFVPEIVAQSDLVALVPWRLVEGRCALIDFRWLPVRFRWKALPWGWCGTNAAIHMAACTGFAKWLLRHLRKF